MSISDYGLGIVKDIWTMYAAAQPSEALFSQYTESFMTFG